MKLAAYCIAMTMLVAQGIPGTAGFQQVTVPDPSGKPLTVEFGIRVMEPFPMLRSECSLSLSL
jgi:hypothetical protein